MITIIKNGYIVTGSRTFTGDIKIENGIITQLGTNLGSKADKHIDATGLYVLPGAIDVHTHFDYDNGVARTIDDFTSGSKSAIMGGTTTFIDFAVQNKGQSLNRTLSEGHKKAYERTYCDYGFHIAITEWNKSVKDEMIDIIQSGVPSFKINLSKKDIIINDGDIYDALIHAKKIGALIGFHCENGDLIDIRVKNSIAEKNTTPYYHMESRPAILEAEAISRLNVISTLTQSPVWISPLSTAQGLNVIKNALSTGQKLIVETCPQYLLLHSSKYGEPDSNDFQAAKYVIEPPLRKEGNQDWLWKGIKDNIINFVSSDHYAFNYKEQKELGLYDFSDIPCGCPGVEDRLLLLYTYGVCEKRITMEQMISVISENPAKIMGLTKKGSLALGNDADIVLLDPNYEDKFSVKSQFNPVDYSTYEGMKRKGKIKKVLLRGEEIVADGKLTGLRPTGTFQHRNSCQLI